jgi:hypothetical protein
MAGTSHSFHDVQTLFSLVSLDFTKNSGRDFDTWLSARTENIGIYSTLRIIRAMKGTRLTIAVLFGVMLPGIQEDKAVHLRFLLTPTGF